MNYNLDFFEKKYGKETIDKVFTEYFLSLIASKKELERLTALVEAKKCLTMEDLQGSEESGRR